MEKQQFYLEEAWEDLGSQIRHAWEKGGEKKVGNAWFIKKKKKNRFDKTPAEKKEIKDNENMSNASDPCRWGSTPIATYLLYSENKSSWWRTTNNCWKQYNIQYKLGLSAPNILWRNCKQWSPSTKTTTNVYFNLNSIIWDVI